MPQAIVTVENAFKEYSRGSEKVEVLKGVSLRINQGDFCALIGPSGSGKTTHDIREGNDARRARAREQRTGRRTTLVLA